MSKQTILPIHINHSNVVDINNNVNNVNNNNDDDDKMGDIPCTIGQQMAGSLFGFLLSFMALLLTSSNILVVIVMGLCVPIGTRLSATTNSNLLKINTKNIIIVIIVSLIITTIMLKYVFGCSIPSLVLTSLVASFLNDPVMFMINYIMYYYYHHHHDHHYHDKRKDEE